MADSKKTIRELWRSLSLVIHKDPISGVPAPESAKPYRAGPSARRLPPAANTSHRTECYRLVYEYGRAVRAIWWC
jgi:hypothetical protein